MTPVVQEGTPVLREKAEPVSTELFGTPELAQMLQDMDESLDAERNGVALAAPQIGLPYRIFIVRYDRMKETPEEGQPPREPEVGVFINPEFVKVAKRRIPMEEGCLSVAGKYGTTERHERASVKAQDASGNWFERGAGGILAQAFQHEIDHLNGILFIDHATDLRDVEPGDRPRRSRADLLAEDEHA